jgi:hypothetical protein
MVDFGVTCSLISETLADADACHASGHQSRFGLGDKIGLRKQRQSWKKTLAGARRQSRRIGPSQGHSNTPRSQPSAVAVSSRLPPAQATGQALEAQIWQICMGPWFHAGRVRRNSLVRSAPSVGNHSKGSQGDLDARLADCLILLLATSLLDQSRCPRATGQGHSAGMC